MPMPPDPEPRNLRPKYAESIVSERDGHQAEPFHGKKRIIGILRAPRLRAVTHELLYETFLPY